MDRDRILHLPGTQNEAIAPDKQQLFLSATWEKIPDLVGPTYVLDNSFHFADWNPAFDELFAIPLKLTRGSHVGAFVSQLANVDDVVQRSVNRFGKGVAPQTDTELLQLDSADFGRVVFRKIAVQIPDDEGNILGWSVHLVLLEADDAHGIWAQMIQRLEHEVTWSRYANVYDELLQNFPKYNELLDDIAANAGNGRRCIDLGAGTGNSSIRLLKKLDDRIVYAVDSNDVMLRLFRAKLTATLASRIYIVKDDVQNLSGFEDSSFDCATMVNVLYALDDPAATLRQVNRILVDNGILVISTTHENTDVNGLLEELRQALIQKGLFEKMKHAFDVAKDRHAAIENKVRSLSINDLVTLITQAGFKILDEKPVYSDKLVMFVAAKSDFPQ